MPITRELLIDAGVTPARADRYLPDLQQVPAANGIDTDLRIAHFLAQVLHESGNLKAVVENLNYSAERLPQVFGKRRFNAAQARAYAGDPERIGNRVYANRLGNGDEASGDGFRYRGRGLIQLTGKSWYKRLSEFVGEDLVAKPQLVATRYPVHSAVFFWLQRKVNAMADADDVAGVTRLVNGRAMHGLARRTARLERVKGLLALQPGDLLGAPPTHLVTVGSLNLRSRPLVRPSTRRAVLSEGTPVTVVGKASKPGWVQVRTVVGGRLFEGVLHSRFLDAIRAPEAEAPPKPVPTPTPAPGHAALEVHLPANRSVTRARDGGRAFPLGEVGMPRRKPRARPEKGAAELLDIVRFLDSSKRAHKRYWPRGQSTFCNIYAYDYCCLAGVYLPRVWWKPAALAGMLAGGERPVVRYDGSVHEVAANGLFDWLGEHGPDFGWQREPSLDVLQASANGGSVCVIVAKQRDPNRSGHISAVVPEHDRHEAYRGPSGHVLRPLESQAGSKNHRFVVKPRRWWEANHYGQFGFFRHA